MLVGVGWAERGWKGVAGWRATAKVESQDEWGVLGCGLPGECEKLLVLRRQTLLLLLSPLVFPATPIGSWGPR